MMKFSQFLEQRERLDEMAARRSKKRSQSKWGPGGKKPVAILTAFQGGSRPLARLVQNRAANRKLVQAFKDKGLSFYPVHGMGQEEVRYLWGLIRFRNPTEEESFVVQPIGDMPEQEFMSIIQGFLQEFNQYAAATKLPSEQDAFLLHPNGNRSIIGSEVGDRTPQDDYFSQLHGGPRAPDAQLSPYELTGETNPLRRVVNRIRGRADMNQPADRSKIGQRFSVRQPQPPQEGDET
jgi:hypothetical protein